MWHNQMNEGIREVEEIMIFLVQSLKTPQYHQQDAVIQQY